MVNTIKQICCIGAGYVGGPTMSVIALKCPHLKVTVVDINKERIEAWNSDCLPIYEPGLDEIVKKVRNKNLFFSTDIDSAIYNSEVIFISVNTPTKTEGIGAGMAADLKYVELCARTIASVSKTNKIVVEKSTLPVKTAQTLKNIFDNNSLKGISFEVISNPEFLAEGTAVEDLLNSDRVLIGGEETESGNKAIQTVASIYRNWIPEERIVTTNLWSAELSKLVANAFLAQRISSINSISSLCEVTGANINEVANTIGMDNRIGNKFLKSSVGFGGSCFQKDIFNLVYICNHYNLKEVAEYWLQVIKINDYQKNRFAENIIKSLYNTVSGKKISFFGWAFKKDTNDSRETAAIYVCDKLLKDGAEINIYEPKIKKDQIHNDLTFLWNLRGEKSNKIKSWLKNVVIHDNCYSSVVNSHAVAVLTDWDEFLDYDWNKIYNSMQKPSFVFDGRNFLNKKELNKIGFKLYSIGSLKTF
ncbi:MAG: nucleotide sugar dehydrogenase [Flavobacteriaceae bacterium]|jgi:UDPglucose 6-dehydrogenase|nr:nucleotide sugar dehydrogenase [Flavobacteriaceae bacterium]MBT6448781.1 nucleotide sugar dehydrogenase [Flavobacteriaceae bacterium]